MSVSMRLLSRYSCGSELSGRPPLRNPIPHKDVYSPSSNWVTFNCTNPVTGSAIASDANASYPARQEPDALGRDLTNPPDVGLPSQPLANPLFKDRAMPIDYTGGTPAYYEEGNAWWAGVMAEQTWQYQHGYFDKGGYFDIK